MLQKDCSEQAMDRQAMSMTSLSTGAHIVARAILLEDGAPIEASCIAFKIISDDGGRGAPQDVQPAPVLGRVVIELRVLYLETGSIVGRDCSTLRS